MEAGAPPKPALMVDRFTGIFPGETCGTPGATEPLQETYWRLTRIEGKPVVLREKQREPNLVFGSGQNRLSGFTGCNRLMGSYHLNGEQLTFQGVASTRMACLDGMDIEQAFLSALGKVRKWKIEGQHLDLNDENGNQIARFEARALR
jgi:copper homeostasis protein (lipoprotein)